MWLESILEDQQKKSQSFLQDPASFDYKLNTFPISLQAKKNVILLHKINQVFFHQFKATHRIALIPTALTFFQKNI